MEKKERLFIGEAPQIRRATFEVYHFDLDPDKEDVIKQKFSDVLFITNGCLAGDWAAIGIVYRELCAERGVLLIRNPDDRFYAIEGADNEGV